jgi:hypothetical protein
MKIALTALAIAAFSSPAQAVTVANGVVLFNQADALAGNVTPGDAPGFPVTLSAIGVYRLSGNLLPTAGKDGIDVTAPDVTIDMFGFRLAGGGAALNGINGHQRALTVTNGTIRGFTKSGILADSDYLRVTGVRSTDNGEDGIDASKSDFVRVTDGFFVNNFRNAVYCASKCSIQNSTLSNGLAGANVGARSSVIGNVISDIRRYGIFSSSFTDAVGFGDNIIMGAGGDGPPFGPTGGNSPVIPLHPNVCVPAC